MAKLKRLGNFTASVLLVISLTFFNFSVPAVFAQDGDNSAAGVGNTDSGSNTQVATGDVNVVVDAGNEANTNTVSTNGNTESSGLTATPAPENDLNADSNLSASPSPSVSPEAMEDTVIPTPVPAPSPTPDLTSENA